MGARVHRRGWAWVSMVRVMMVMVNGHGARGTGRRGYGWRGEYALLFSEGSVEVKVREHVDIRWTEGTAKKRKGKQGGGRVGESGYGWGEGSERIGESGYG